MSEYTDNLEGFIKDVISELKKQEVSEIDFIQVTIARKEGSVSQLFAGSNRDMLNSVLTAIQLLANQTDTHILETLAVVTSALIAERTSTELKDSPAKKLMEELNTGGLFKKH